MLNQKKLIALPIDEKIAEIHKAFLTHQNLVLTAEPGAGKTTRLPPAAMNWVSGKILVLEPRRMAAVAAAHRICEENDWQLGEHCGYQVRFENKTQASTRLIFQTEALLVKRLLNDPDLKGVELVILDEFHERSANVDLALGVIREMQLLGHPIRLLVMSATLEAEKISSFLGEAPIVRVKGSLHPLQVTYSKKPQSLRIDPDFFKELNELTKTVFQSSQKDILVFLPGTGEIRRAIENALPWAQANEAEVLPLHGSLSLAEQTKALKAGAKRRIIFSTNIAESSVTVDGVDRVIDSGLARVNRWDIRTGFSKLKIERISKFSATQRAGRAARQQPGTVYRMWNPMDEISMSLDQDPEIARTDLSESLLYLYQLGVTQFENFTWYETPPSNHIERAKKFLIDIDLLNDRPEIQEKRKQIADLPLNVRLACLLYEGRKIGQLEVAAAICAVLQEKDFLKAQALPAFKSEKSECDLQTRVEILLDGNGKNFSSDVHRPALNLVLDLMRKLEKFGTKTSNAPNESLKETIEMLLMSTFSDRLAKRRKGTSKGLMIGGRGVRLHEESLVSDSDFFFCLDGMDGIDSSESIVRWASGLTKERVLKLFANQITKARKVVYDEGKSAIMAEESRFLRDLPIDEPVYSQPTPAEIEKALPEILSANWDLLLAKNEALKAWMQRWHFFLETLKSFPDLWNDQWGKLQECDFTEARRLEALTAAAMGNSKLQNLLEADLNWAFEASLPASLVQFLDRELPLKMKVPSGNSLALHYSFEQGVHIEVRLQEVFGWNESPKLLLGKVPLTFHLLAPNYRPVQLTKDLASFWKNTYPEVKKELRIRYSKHSWPDDPLTAEAVSKGRPRK